jgi:hypothetical protein
VSFFPFFIYLFIFYIEINNNSKRYTLHTQEILFPSDIFPGSWSKLSGTDSIPPPEWFPFADDKTSPFHYAVDSLDCHPTMETEFVPTGQKTPKTTPQTRAQITLISSE